MRVILLTTCCLLDGTHPQVKARKEAARKDDVIDNVTEEQLQAIEDEFLKATEAPAAVDATAVDAPVATDG